MTIRIFLTRIMLASAHERSIKQVVDLEKYVDDLKSDTTRRVVVVTPKICVSVAPGQIEEIGKLDLPASVLQKLVAKQVCRRDENNRMTQEACVRLLLTWQRS